MKYLNKTFSVGGYVNNSQPKCLCGKEISYGFSTQEGYMCQECYFKRKQEIAEAKIKKLIKENSE